MYKLKYENVRRVVSTEKEKEELIKQGYSLMIDDEQEEQPKDEIIEEDIQEPTEEETTEDIQEPTEEETTEDTEESDKETEEDVNAKKGRGKSGK